MKTAAAAGSAALAALIMTAADSRAQSIQTGFIDRSVTVDGIEYPYQVYVPRSYAEAGAEPWPVILFLHGAGERGDDGLLQTHVGLGPAIRQWPDRYPAIVVFPQAPLETRWTGAPGRAAMAALDATLAGFSTDPGRVYLTGMSMGGNGAWYLAYRFPERFAAIAVVCGWVADFRGLEPIVPAEDGPPFETLAERLRGLPAWIFHGEVDAAVPVEQSRRAAAALAAAGADVRYTELPGVGHDAWTPAYSSPAFADWLFEQRRR